MFQDLTLATTMCYKHHHTKFQDVTLATTICYKHHYITKEEIVVRYKNPVQVNQKARNTLTRQFNHAVATKLP